MMNAQTNAAETGIDQTLALRALLADNIRQRAQILDLRLNAVADLAGVSRSQFYNVLRLNSSPSLDWVAKVAHVLQVPPAALLARPMPVQPSNWPSAAPNNFVPPYPMHGPGAPQSNENFAPYGAPRVRPGFPDAAPLPLPPRPLSYR